MFRNLRLSQQSMRLGGAPSAQLCHARPRLYSKLEIEPAIHASPWGTGSTYCSAVKRVRSSGIAHDHTHIVYVITCGCSAWLAGQVPFALDGANRPSQRTAMHKDRLPASGRQQQTGSGRQQTAGSSRQHAATMNAQGPTGSRHQQQAAAGSGSRQQQTTACTRAD